MLKTKLLIFLLFFLYTSNYAETNNQKELFKLGFSKDWKPYTYVDSDNKPAGIFIDYLNYLSQLCNFEIEWMPGELQETINRVVNGELDAHIALTQQGVRRAGLLPSIPYYRVDPQLVSLSPVEDIKSLSDLSGKTLIVHKDWAVTKVIERDYPKINLIFSNSESEAIKLLLNSRGDYYFNDSSVLKYYISNNYDEVFYYSSSLRIMEPSNQRLMMGVSPNSPEVLKIVDKGIQSIQNNNITAIFKNNDHIDLNSFYIYNSLSAAESAFIEECPPIKTVILKNTPPLSFVDEGLFQGITSDYMSILEENLNIKFSIQDDVNWNEALTLIKSGEVDMIATIAPTISRKNDMLFTVPYFHIAIAPFGSEKAPYLTTLEELRNRKVYVIKDYSIGGWLREDLPGIELFEVADTSEGLQKIARDPSAVYIGNILSVNEELRKNNRSNIHIIGDLQYGYETSIAIKKDWPLLRSAITKELINIMDSDKSKIESKWLSRTIKVKMDNKTLVIIILSFSLLTIIFFIIVYFLNQKHRQASKNADTDQLTGLLNRRALNRVFDNELNKMNRMGYNLLICIYDLDNFKKYNDSYGHNAGDKALQTFGKIMKEAFKRSGEYSFRVGGEEFLTITPLVSSDDHIYVANRLRKLLINKKIPHINNSDNNIMTLSGGGILITDNRYSDFETIYKIIDKQLYKAKTNGRNRVYII